jgi:hypothetical protein
VPANGGLHTVPIALDCEGRSRATRRLCGHQRRVEHLELRPGAVLKRDARGALPPADQHAGARQQIEVLLQRRCACDKRSTSRGLVDRLASREGSAPALPRRLGWHKARPSDVWMGGQGFDPTLATGPFTRSRSTLAVDLAYHRLVISAAANCSEFSIVLRGQSPVSAHRLEKSPIICPITAGKSAASDLGHRAPSPLLSMVRKGDSNPHNLAIASPSSG